MKKALILGCSHAIGTEISKEPGLVFDNFDQGTNYELIHCYPAQIARALGYLPINQGIGGGSNDAMFRLFLENSLTPDDIVIACWTGVNRSEIYDERWKQLCPGLRFNSNALKINSDYYKHWLLYSSNTEVGMPNKIKNILALNALAHAQGIQVINIDSFWPISFWPAVNFTWPDIVKWPVDIDFMAWCVNNKFPHTETVHFYKSAHDSYAEYILKNLNS